MFNWIWLVLHGYCPQHLEKKSEVGRRGCPTCSRIARDKRLDRQARAYERQQARAARNQSRVEALRDRRVNG